LTWIPNRKHKVAEKVIDHKNEELHICNFGLIWLFFCSVPWFGSVP